MIAVLVCVFLCNLHSDRFRSDFLHGYVLPDCGTDMLVAIIGKPVIAIRNVPMSRIEI